MARRAAAGRVAAIAIAVVAAWLAGARPAAAAEGARYALLIQGASGGEPYETMHREWLDALASVLRDRFKYDAAHLFVFADEPRAGEERSTAANVRTVLGRIATTMGASDQLVVVFIGHGGGEGPDAKFNLVGPDLGVAEWKALLAPMPGRLAVVDTTSASFPYLAGLAAPGRVVITATSSYSQRFDTDFPDGFVKAFSDDEADPRQGRPDLPARGVHVRLEAGRRVLPAEGHDGHRARPAR